MTPETQEEPAQGAGQEPEEKPAAQAEPDIADEEELDIAIERVAPKRTGGCGPVFWITLVILLAAVAFAQGLMYQKAEQEKAKRVRESRYQAAEVDIEGTVGRAANLAKSGDVEGAVKQLDIADDKLTKLLAEAQSSKDAEKAQSLNVRRDEFKAALSQIKGITAQVDEHSKRIEELKAEIKALEDKKAALRDDIAKRITSLSAYGGPSSYAEPAPSEQAPEAANAAPQGTANAAP